MHNLIRVSGHHQRYIAEIDGLHGLGVTREHALFDLAYRLDKVDFSREDILDSDVIGIYPEAIVVRYDQETRWWVAQSADQFGFTHTSYGLNPKQAVACLAAETLGVRVSGPQICIA